MIEAERLHGDEHVRRYRETDGEVGHVWRRGSKVLLLTTTGRRSGKPRTKPLIYEDAGDGRYVVVASKGGFPKHPEWYLNLVAEPEVEVQLLGEVFRARARTAEGEDRERLWRLAARQWPDYDAYQGRTEREIPVVVLERL